jgi:hypothetical protein
MHYTAKRQNNRHFEVTNERQELVGSVDYTDRQPGKAQIKINDSDTFKAIPRKSRDAAAGITKNGSSYAELKCNWQKSMVLTLENGKSFYFTRKNIWDSNYAVLNDAQHEVASIKSKFQWRTMRFNYEIDVRPRMLDKESKTTLPFLLVYCTQYVRSHHSAIVPAKIAASLF